MRLKDKIAIVTGAAGNMGSAQSALFAREGATVILADIRDPEGQAASENINSSGGKSVYWRLDVSDENAWQKTVADAVKQFGRLDILVNNAGMSGMATDLMDTEIWQRLLAINATGVFLGMKYAIQAMKPNGGGAIVNISSTTAFGAVDMVHMGYPASKAACHLATKAAAVQNARFGIRVNSIHPGMHPPMAATKAFHEAANADPGVREKFFEKIPMGRAGRVEELANAVLFLASDDASYITGTSLLVDGGWLAAQ